MTIHGIEVYKVRHSMQFEGDGWKELIHVPNLELGYFLVFSYKGNMVFNFKAYDLSTCEIAYPSLVCSKIKIKERSHNKVNKEENLDPSMVIVLIFITIILIFTNYAHTGSSFRRNSTVRGDRDKV